MPAVLTFTAEVNLDGLVDAVTDAARRSARFGESLEAVGDRLSKLMGPLALIALPAMRAAEDHRLAMVKIQRVAAVTGQALEPLKAAFSATRTETSATMDETASVLAALAVSVSGSAADMTALATSTIRLARVAGADLGTTAQKTATLFAAWGVGARDGAGMLGQLAVTARTSAGGLGGALDALARGAATFRTAGIALQPAMQIISGMGLAGLNAEQAISALSQALGRLAQEGSGDIARALRQRIQSIRSAYTTTDAVRMAVELFGEQGARLADAIQSGKLVMDDAGTLVGQIPSSEPVADLGKAFKKLMVAVQDAIEPLGETLIKEFPQIVTAAQFTIEILAALVDGFLKLSEGVQQAAISVSVFLVAMGPIAAAFGRIIAASARVVRAFDKIFGRKTALLAAILIFVGVGYGCHQLVFRHMELADQARTSMGQPMDIAQTITIDRAVPPTPLPPMPQWFPAPELACPSIQNEPMPPPTWKLDTRIVDVPPISLPEIKLQWQIDVEKALGRHDTVSAYPEVPSFEMRPGEAPWDAMKRMAEKMRIWFGQMASRMLLGPGAPSMPGAWLDSNTPEAWYARAAETERLTRAQATVTDYWRQDADRRNASLVQEWSAKNDALIGMFGNLRPAIYVADDVFSAAMGGVSQALEAASGAQVFEGMGAANPPIKSALDNWADPWQLSGFSQEYLRANSGLSSQEYARQNSGLNSQEYVRENSGLNSQAYSRANSDLSSQEYARQNSGLNSQEYVRENSGLNSQAYSRANSGLSSQEYARQNSGLNSQEYVRENSGLNSQAYSRANSGLSSQEYGRLNSGLSSQDYGRRNYQPLPPITWPRSSTPTAAPAPPPAPTPPPVGTSTAWSGSFSFESLGYSSKPSSAWSGVISRGQF